MFVLYEPLTCFEGNGFTIKGDKPGLKISSPHIIETATLKGKNLLPWTVAPSKRGQIKSISPAHKHSSSL